MPKLILTNGLEKRVVPLVDVALTVGRDPDNAVTIESPDVSRRHCRFEPDGPGHWRVVDLGSKNGTFLNGRPVTAPHRIAIKDTVTIGDAQLVLTAEDEPADFEEMPVTTFARTRIELLVLDLGKTVGFELLLEVLLVHMGLPSNCCVRR